MALTRLELDEDDQRYLEPIQSHDLSDESGEMFRFIKGRLEEILSINGYDVPVRADGISSTETEPVYSRGVRKGQPDLYGQTAEVGKPAVKTVYGAAVAELDIEVKDPNSTILEFLTEILTWYQEHPEWSFGGIDNISKTEKGYLVTLYAGASNRGSRQFFTAKESDAGTVVDKIYTVHENPSNLRWIYQVYEKSGDFSYKILRKYSLGSNSSQRFYVDAVVTPAVMAGQDGRLQGLWHSVMVYHEKGEILKDYLTGDRENGYQVPLTEVREKIEITTEREQVERETQLRSVYDEKTGVHRIHVTAEGTDAFGMDYSDEKSHLTLSFLAVTPEKTSILSAADLERLGQANVYGYTEGERIGFVQYQMIFGNASVGVSVSSGNLPDDTYIVTKRLIYRGQHKVSEDGDTKANPVQVLERPIKQKLKVIKTIEKEDGKETALPNFRFKLYLKSNLSRLYRNDTGEILWLDHAGEPVDIEGYRNTFPELVQKLDTWKGSGTYPVLETLEEAGYEKFFDAMGTADKDLWHNREGIKNTSFKPFGRSILTGVENQINTSPEAREIAERSDAVRQFAVNWYLKEETEKLLDEKENEIYQAKKGTVVYGDEIYDKALYQAILRAEEYLKPFFRYDLDTIYAVPWDNEPDGGIDKDLSTLAANT